MSHPRVLLASLAVTLVAGAGAAAQGTAGAEPKVEGKYAAKFERVANNCTKAGMSLASTTVDVSQPKTRSVSVTIPAVPIMSGSVSRGGKFRAVARRGKTAIKGVDGRFSVAGRVEKRNIQFLFIAEYFEGEKPLCTQSWNASGPRQ